MKEQNPVQTDAIMGRRYQPHLTMSEYIFEGIPYVGRSFWSLSYPIPFAKWTSYINTISISDFIHQLNALFIVNKLHEGDSGKYKDNYIILRANSRFADYIHPFQLAERYYNQWVYAMTVSPFESNREAVMDNVYPIHIDIVDNTHPIQISVSLHSDFWFPWCMGWTYDNPAKSKDEMYDNRQLAWRHTPRLNQCLSEIRALVLDTGGTWEIGAENAHEEYQHMVTETGIELSMPENVKYIKNNE